MMSNADLMEGCILTQGKTMVTHEYDVVTDACLKTTTTLFDDDSIANFDAVIVDREECCT